MKVKKIKLEEVQQGTIKEAVHKKEFIRAIKEMEANFTNFEDQLDFFFRMDQDFDNGKSKGLLCVIGTRKNEWKKFLKDELKNNKKQTLAGYCFLDVSNGEKVLQLIPKKGSAKLDKLFKDGKVLFKKEKVRLQIAEGFDAATLEEDEEITPDSPAEEPSPADALFEEVQQGYRQLVELAKNLKSNTDKAALSQSIYKVHALKTELEAKLVAHNSTGQPHEGLNALQPKL